MSKLDAVRALREARFNQERSRPATPRTTPTTSTTTSPTTSPTKPRTTAVPESTADDTRCGHRNISGRECTRERGHAAKTHRYTEPTNRA